MTKYEYKLIEDSDTYSYGIDDINEQGKAGWRLVWTLVSDSGKEKSLFEKVIEE